MSTMQTLAEIAHRAYWQGDLSPDAIAIQWATAATSGSWADVAAAVASAVQPTMEMLQLRVAELSQENERLREGIAELAVRLDGYADDGTARAAAPGMPDRAGLRLFGAVAAFRDAASAAREVVKS